MPDPTLQELVDDDVYGEWQDDAPPRYTTPVERSFDDYIQQMREARPMVQRAARRLTRLRRAIALAMRFRGGPHA